MRAQMSCAAVLILALAGCGGRYGAIRWDGEAGRACEAAQVLPGHRYYTAGSENKPDAILALRDDRTLRHDSWHEVRITPEELARLVDRMRGSRVEPPYGSVVLDDAGTRIGMWCSYLKAVPLKILDDGSVVISPPLPEMSDPSRPSGAGKD